MLAAAGHRAPAQNATIRLVIGGRKSWQLWVNTAYADRSFGVYEVQAFDVVYWRFATKEGK